MASVTRNNERSMASDRRDDDEDERDDRDEKRRPTPPRETPPRRDDERGGFFTIYKPGQGYWTRLGTGIAAALIILLTIQFIWQYIRPALEQAFTPAAATTEQSLAAAVTARNVTLGICIGTGAVLGALVWYLMNKPSNADFLIATDSEMKKVNWTSKKDLIGSTKVVIAFMFLIAAFLFVVDVFFGYFFYFIRVLHNRPF